MKEAYLMAWGDIFTLEQLHKQLHVPKGRKLADELFHLLLDHLIVEDFPQADVSPEVTEKLKGMIDRAKAGIPEMVEKLERGEEPTGEEAYERALSGANGFLWGKILNPRNPHEVFPSLYPRRVQPRYPSYREAFGWAS